MRDLMAAAVNEGTGRSAALSVETFGKTGTTQAAGESLVASVTRDGHRVMATVLGSQDRYADVETLFDHYFASFRWTQAPQPSGPSSWVRAADGRPLRVTAPDAPDLFLDRWQWPQVRPQVSLDTPLAAPGQPAGVVRWYLGSRLLAEAPAMLSEY